MAAAVLFALANTLLLFSFSAHAVAAGDIVPWTTASNSLPGPRELATSTTANGYIYEIGGENAYLANSQSTVYYAHQNSDGSVGDWQTANPLPAGRVGAASVVVNGYLYVIGGENDNGSSHGTFATVYYAQLNSDGSVGDWQTADSSLPEALYLLNAVASNGYIYVTGGQKQSGSASSTVYYTSVNDDGTLAPWQAADNSLPQGVLAASTVTSNGVIYVTGGYVNNFVGSDAQYYAQLNSDGSVGTWNTSLNPLPTPVVYGTAATVGGYLYVMNGVNVNDQTATDYSNKVFYAPINTDGSIGTWATSGNVVPDGLIAATSVFARGYIYVIGGGGADSTVGIAPQTGVYYTHLADALPPVLSTPVWSQNPKSTSTTATLTVPVTDTISGIQKAEYYLGETDPGQGNGTPMTLSHVSNDGLSANLTATFGTNMATGAYKVTIRAEDNAGNWSDSTVDYLVVYSPSGAKMMGRNSVTPSLANGDILPGLTTSNQRDEASFGFNIKYDKNGVIGNGSDFAFSYKTGSDCNKKQSSGNRHSLDLNATSIAWLTTQGTNNSTGIFQGTATLVVDGQRSNVQFRVTSVDGERLSQTTPDQFQVQIFSATANPNTDTPIYRVNQVAINRGSIKIMPN